MSISPIPSPFTKLKPLCIEFLRNCSIENIEKIENVVYELDAKSLDSLLEFIALPFRAQLSTNLSEKLCIRCIDFLTHIFKKLRIKLWHIFRDLFTLMISKINDLPNEPNNVIDGREELKLSVCQFLTSLVSSATQELLNEMYSLTFRPNLGHAFYLFNIMLKQEKSKSLIKAVLSTLGALTYSEKFVCKKFKMTEEIASEALASCLPGLAIALYKVACGDFKQGHAIFVLALDILADVIVLVIGDESYKRGIANDPSSEVYNFAYRSGKQDTLDEQTCKSISMVKNDLWFKTASKNLEILVNNLTVLASHEHWKIRLAFLKFTESMLLNCTKTLETCIPILLPVVFSLSVDENEVIALQCGNLIAILSEQFQNMSSASLNSIIEDNIEKLTSELMKCKISASDTKKLTALKCLLGYIKILGSSLNLLLFSIVHIERIALTLITLLEFDTSILNMVEEIPTIENFNLSNLAWPKKRFKYFSNEEILNIVCKICYSLCCIQNSRLIIDYLIRKLSSNDLYTLQCVFLIGSVIEGFSKESNAAEKYVELINDVIEIFLSNTMFDPSIQDEGSLHLEKQKNIPSTNLVIANGIFNKNKLQICLVLEALSKCSICLGKEFKLHLMNTLFPVMEKTGSSHFIISQCGKLCLNFFAHSCGYNSVNELIKDNADYITNVLMINFHQYFHKPEIAVVLCVAMEQCDSEAVVLFRDLIFQILNILDYNQSNAFFFMTVLFSVVVSIKKWFPSKDSIVICKPMIKVCSQENLRVAILDFITLEEKSTCDVDNDLNVQDELADDYTDGDLSEEKKCQAPLHINISCEILKRCVHLQSFENVYLRMLVLETVEQCIIILKDYENKLHPLIHEFWNPFLKRFTEEAFTSKAFNVLVVIASECGEFIRQRTFKDVMPKLVHFLKTECAKSRFKGNFNHYQWTADHALQVLILSEIGHLCTKFDIDDKDINTVVNVCLPYIEKEQPKILQDAALKSLQALAILNLDAIWFYWNTLYSENMIYIPPYDYLSEISFPYSNDSLTIVTVDF